MTPIRIEWPTIAVAIAITCGFTGLLLAHEHVPAVAELAVLGALGAWYNSLQHEVIHGHPTPWRGVNTALASVPLGLVVPFSSYRELHLAHHRSAHLSEPGLDPESFSAPRGTGARPGPWRRAAWALTDTLAGRLVLGPLIVAGRWVRIGLAGMRTPAGLVRILTHVAAVAVVLLTVRAAGMSLWVYVAGVAWVGTGLSLLRSFAEHRQPDGAAGTVDDLTRSAVVRAGWFFSLLYLNNNLHHTHHARPGLPWFSLPAAHEALGADEVAAAGAGLYGGYGDVARRYLFRRFA